MARHVTENSYAYANDLPKYEEAIDMPAPPKGEAEPPTYEVVRDSHSSSSSYLITGTVS